MNNRSDCVLIQQASGDYQALLALTVGHHLNYCLRHGMDYWPIFGEARSRFVEQLPHFDRVSLIKTALEAGYEKVIWLDADCVIIGDDDMRQAVPDEGIGALWCEGDWVGDMYDHFCTGALYVHGDRMTEGFVDSWWCCEGVTHGWQDQHAFNEILGDMWVRTGVVKPLSRHWHTILPNYPPEDDRTPQVVAFHGYGNLEQRLACMRALFGDFGGVQ